MSETTQAPSTDRRPSRGRGITAVILFIIASLLLPIGVLTFWGQQTVTDTDRYVETVAPISADPAIQDAVATVVSSQVTSSLNLDAALSGYLPANGQVLVGPLTAALDTLIDRAVRAVLASPRFNQAWLRINEAAQKSLMALLEGNQNGPLQVNTSGQIVLDTTSLYEAVRAELVSSGTAFADKLPATIPPAADKQVVLLQSDQFARAQTAYALTKPLATWLLFLAIALFAIAIALSRRRPRMVLATGIAVLVSAALLKVGLAAGGELVHLVFSSTPFAGAESVFFETLTRFLANAINWLMVIGVALAVGGWLFGSSRPALALRGWASKATGSVTDSVSGSVSGSTEGMAGSIGGAVTSGSRSVGAWVADNTRLLIIAIGAVAVVIVLALMLSTTQLLVVVLAALLIGGVLWLGRSRETAADDAGTTPASEPVDADSGTSA